MIKKFNNFVKESVESNVDPYGEEEWIELEITRRNNIYLCVENDQDFKGGNVYIIHGINQNVVGNNMIGTHVKMIGKSIDEYIQINFNVDEDPFKYSLANGSLIYIGKLDN